MMLIRGYGEMWARDVRNIKKIPRNKENCQGVYILYDGSMPVYIGKGNIHNRIIGAKKSHSRGPFWDHFSWYEIRKPDLQHDVEALFLSSLPWYIRALNKQRAKFKSKMKFQPEKDQIPEPITRQRLKPKPKPKPKRKRKQ